MNPSLTLKTLTRVPFWNDEKRMHSSFPVDRLSQSRSELSRIPTTRHQKEPLHITRFPALRVRAGSQPRSTGEVLLQARCHCSAAILGRPLHLIQVVSLVAAGPRRNATGPVIAATTPFPQLRAGVSVKRRIQMISPCIYQSSSSALSARFEIGPRGCALGDHEDRCMNGIAEDGIGPPVAL